MTVTLSDVHEQLRRDTAAMLKYDYTNLTAAQSVRLDRAAMIRLELDDCQTKKLAGQPFDMNKYIVSSEALERLFGGDPEAPNQTREDDDESAGAREKLSQFLSDRAEKLERGLRSDNPNVRAGALRNMAPWISAIIAELWAQLAEKDALIEQLRTTAPPSVAAPSQPVGSKEPPEKQIPPLQTNNQPSPPLRAEPPAHYLRRIDGFDVIQGGRYDRWSNRG
jgi:hypothetical protein